jgi:hypothetical protein
MNRPVAKIDRPGDIVCAPAQIARTINPGTAGHEYASFGKHVFEIPLINHVQRIRSAR